MCPARKDPALDRSAPAPSDQPLASVIVPAWNAASTIERALDSVLAGGRPDVECVVVDDGSTDATVELVSSREARDPRVVLVRSPVNEGVSSARNRGLGVARGTWLTFLDADDRLLPGGLEAMLRATRQLDARAVVGQRVWSDGRTAWISAAYDIPDITTPGRKAVATHPGLMYYASATGKLFHRSLADGLTFSGRVLGDQPWTIRALIRAGDRIAVIGDVVYEWTRPAGESAATITAAKRASARLAAEAARVAVGALAEVAGEAAIRVADPATRQRIVHDYFERIVRSDLEGPVHRAVARGDDGAEELFEAIEAFLATAPPELVEHSAAVAEGLLRGPLDRWLKPREPARAAYLRLLRAELTAHQGLVPLMAGPGLLRAAVWLLLRSDAPLARAAASALLVLHWPFGLPGRWRRRRRRVAMPSRAALKDAC